jgi:hypothetical protein
VYVNVAFGDRLPLVKTFVSLTIVCVVESLFVHVTVVPTLTVSVAGEKAKFAMVTEFPDAGVEDVFVEVVPYPDEHADSETSAIRVTIVNVSGNDRFKNLFIFTPLCIFEYFSLQLLWCYGFAPF